jgi:DNA-directed RNA polymerase specialized sigma24 family protein
LTADDSIPDEAEQSSNLDDGPSGKKKWTLTAPALDKLLAELSPDREEAGSRYELLRRKLVRFFECRQTEPADEFADETINRVARRIDEGQLVDNIAAYALGVARLLCKEITKHPNQKAVQWDETQPTPATLAPVTPDDEPRFNCFDACLDSLSSDSRALIMDYYQAERRAKIELRQKLADKLGIPLNALRIRAHRIRNGLKKCLDECLSHAT